MENCTISDFQILQRIGQGGFGSAYLAQHTSNQQKLCIKFIPLHGGSSGRSAADENKTLSQMEHDNIIKYYGSFVVDDCFCIVMEYASKGSLYDVVEVWLCFIFFLSRILFFIFIVTFAIPLQKHRHRRRKFTEPEVIAILLEISAGLRCFTSLDLSGDSFVLCSFVSIYL